MGVEPLSALLRGCRLRLAVVLIVCIAPLWAQQGSAQPGQRLRSVELSVGGVDRSVNTSMAGGAPRGAGSGSAHPGKSWAVWGAPRSEIAGGTRRMSDGSGAWGIRRTSMSEAMNFSRQVEENRSGSSSLSGQRRRRTTVPATLGKKRFGEGSQLAGNSSALGNLLQVSGVGGFSARASSPFGFNGHIQNFSGWKSAEQHQRAEDAKISREMQAGPSGASHGGGGEKRSSTAAPKPQAESDCGHASVLHLCLWL